MLYSHAKLACHHKDMMKLASFLRPVQDHAQILSYTVLRSCPAASCHKKPLVHDMIAFAGRVSALHVMISCQLQSSTDRQCHTHQYFSDLCHTVKSCMAQQPPQAKHQLHCCLARTTHREAHHLDSPKHLHTMQHPGANVKLLCPSTHYRRGC